MTDTPPRPPKGKTSEQPGVVKFRVRFPTDLKARIEALVGKDGFDAFIDGAVRQRLERDKRGSDSGE